MLLFTSTNDFMQIGTDTNGPLDVHTSWVDTNAGVITPGRKNTAVVAAGLAIIVPAPGASTQRNLKSMHIRNKHASTPCQVIVQHFDGVTAENIFDTRLAAGKSLQYTDQDGFKVL